MNKSEWILLSILSGLIVLMSLLDIGTIVALLIGGIVFIAWKSILRKINRLEKDLGRYLVTREIKLEKMPSQDIPSIDPKQQQIAELKMKLKELENDKSGEK